MSVTADKRPYAKIVAALQEASRAAAELGIDDLFRAGKQREIVIAHHLSHTLENDDGNPLVDAVDAEGRRYSYLAAHYGKRAQIFLSRRAPRGHGDDPRKKDDIHAFIIVFFSADDACDVISIWQCSPAAIWREIEKQAAQKNNPSAPTQSAYFSEALLKTWASKRQTTTPDAKRLFPADRPS